MKVTLESTDQIVDINGVPARVWEGTTAAGIPCHALITRIAVHKNDDATEFERELQETRPPSPALRDVYPARLVL
jgi:hypothetical protein